MSTNMVLKNALVLYEAPFDHNAEKELNELIAECARTKDAIDQFQQLSKRVEDIVVPPNKDADTILGHVQAEFADLQAELSRLTSQQQDHQPEEPEPETESETEPKPDTKPNSALEKLCKKLYKKISLKCHPDRTDNKHFHALFERATELNDQWDLEGLKKIWERVKNHKNNKRKNKSFEELMSETDLPEYDLQQQIVDTQAQLDDLKQHLILLTQSEFSRVISAFKERGRHYAIDYYGRVLELTIEHYEKHCHALRVTLQRMQSQSVDVNMPESYRTVMERARRRQQQPKMNWDDFDFEN